MVEVEVPVVVFALLVVVAGARVVALDDETELAAAMGDEVEVDTPVVLDDEVVLGTNTVSLIPNRLILPEGPPHSCEVFPLQATVHWAQGARPPEPYSMGDPQRQVSPLLVAAQTAPFALHVAIQMSLVIEFENEVELNLRNMVSVPIAA